MDIYCFGQHSHRCATLVTVFLLVIQRTHAISSWFDTVHNQHELDLVVVMERSHAVGVHTFLLAEKTLLGNLLRYHVNISPERTRIGVITYAMTSPIVLDTITTENEERTKCDVIEGGLWDLQVMYLPYVESQGADISEALVQAAAIFHHSVRQSASKVLIVASRGDFVTFPGADRNVLVGLGVTIYTIGLDVVFSTQYAELQMLASEASYYGDASQWWEEAARQQTLAGIHGSEFVENSELFCPEDAQSKCNILLGYSTCICSNHIPCDQVSSAPPSCESSPCYHGATCELCIDIVTCRCLPGYTGQYCEVQINECAAVPCATGGTCLDGNNTFTCDCDNTGFCGPTCYDACDRSDVDGPDQEAMEQDPIDQFRVLIYASPAFLILLVLTASGVYCCLRWRHTIKDRVASRLSVRARSSSAQVAIIDMGEGHTTSRRTLESQSHSGGQNEYQRPRRGSGMEGVPLPPIPRQESTGIGNIHSRPNIPVVMVKPQPPPKPRKTQALQPPKMTNSPFIIPPTTLKKSPPVQPKPQGQQPSLVPPLPMSLHSSISPLQPPDPKAQLQGRTVSPLPPPKLTALKPPNLEEQLQNRIVSPLQPPKSKALKPHEHLDQVQNNRAPPAGPAPEPPAIYVNRPQPAAHCEYEFLAPPRRAEKPAALMEALQGTPCQAYDLAPLHHNLSAWLGYVTETMKEGKVEKMCIIRKDGEMWITTERRFNFTQPQIDELVEHLTERNTLELTVNGRLYVHEYDDNDNMSVLYCEERNEYLCLGKSNEFLVAMTSSIAPASLLEYEVDCVRLHLSALGT